MYTFIINPHARSGLGSLVWKELELILENEKVEYQVFFTKYQRHATQFVRELTSDGEEHTIIMLGGDGTVNEIMNGIQDFSKITLGYIPIGSSNDFSRYYALPKDPAQALQQVLHPTRYAMMNIGKIQYQDQKHQRNFAVSSGLGFDAGVCHQSVTSRLKPLLNRLHLGKLTYVGIALSQLHSIKPSTAYLSLDQDEEMQFEKTYFVTAMNHPYEGGGFKFCPDAIPSDDILNVTVIAGLSKWKVLFLLPTAFKGWHTRFSGVYTFQCKQAHVRFADAQPLHTDGEPISFESELHASLEANKVRFIVG